MTRIKRFGKNIQTMKKIEMCNVIVSTEHEHIANAGLLKNEPIWIQHHYYDKDKVTNFW